MVNQRQCPRGTNPYIIKSGDTLYSIARRFNTTVNAILDANPGINPERLQVGQRICIPIVEKECPPGATPYTIRRGDTVYDIAIRFNTTVSAIVSANPFIEVDNLQIGQVICVPSQPVFPSCPGGNFYTIKEGDTLFAIARRFNVSLADLVEANPGVDQDRLRVGQIICIPLAVPPVTCPPGFLTYTIRAGDTFYSIARRFNTTVDALRRANPNVNPATLLIGQQICIPGPGIR